jgi:2-iminobutanoate/2-iminopropanoate deaminase
MRKQLPIFVTFVLVLSVLGLSYGAGLKRKVVNPQGFSTTKPFSAGIQMGDTLYISGTIGTDPKTQKVPDNFDEEVRQCLENVGEVLKTGGYNFTDAVAVQVYLTDMSKFQQMNAIYIHMFPDPKPTRTTVGVAALASGAHIEVTVTARK